MLIMGQINTLTKNIKTLAKAAECFVYLDCYVHCMKSIMRYPMKPMPKKSQM